MTYTPTPSHWKLARRYGKIPFRSPVNPVLAEMLSTVFTEEEALLASAFPVRPATAEAISRCAGAEAGLVHLTDNVARQTSCARAVSV